MRSMTKRWLVAPLVLAFVVVACGDDGSEPTEEPTSEPTAEATAEVTEEPTADATAEVTEEPTAEPTEEAIAAATEEPAAATEEPAAATAAQVTDEPAAEATTEAAAPTTTAARAGSGATAVMLGDEEITIDRVLCYFEEQPRAGLGGVWTHTLQARGTNPAGVPVVISLDRARSEDGEVEDSVIVDIGEPGAEDAVSLTADGPEGLVEFGDASAAGLDVEVAEFGSDPVPLSIEVDCG